jgi:hypothetical protein
MEEPLCQRVCLICIGAVESLLGPMEPIATRASPSRPREKRGDTRQPVETT